MEHEKKIVTLLRKKIITECEAEMIRKLIADDRRWSFGDEIPLNNGNSLFILVRGNKASFFIGVRH